MSLVFVKGFSFTYAGSHKPTLLGIDLKVEPGEVCALLGASGSGKSTLCFAITGFIPHFFRGTLDGRVQVAGMDVRHYLLGELASVVGLIFQSPLQQVTWAKPTVEEEVAFGLENLGVPRDEMRCRVNGALQEVGLLPLRGRAPHQLSAGEQQRLAIAGALAMGPRVLVLDEATALLDPASAKQVWELARRVADRGGAVIATEHRLDLASTYADRFIVLENGQIVADGPPSQVLPFIAAHDLGLAIPLYLDIALCCRELGLWPKDEPLPASLDQAVEALSRTRFG